MRTNDKERKNLKLTLSCEKKRVDKKSILIFELVKNKIDHQFCDNFLQPITTLLLKFFLCHPQI